VRRIGEAHPRLAEALEAAERDLRAAPDHGPALETAARRGRSRLVEAARSSLPLGALETIEAEERARLSALGERLSPGAAAGTFKRLVEERLLAWFDLPSLRHLGIDPPA
jgi:hypothetical protein